MSTDPPVQTDTGCLDGDTANNGRDEDDAASHNEAKCCRLEDVGNVSATDRLYYCKLGGRRVKVVEHHVHLKPCYAHTEQGKAAQLITAQVLGDGTSRCHATSKPCSVVARYSLLYCQCLY